MTSKNLLTSQDPQIFHLIDQEARRQEEGLEMIASENYCSPAVMLAQGSVLTNKYAEGYPGKRYYDGCHVVDQIEALAIERLKKLFGAEFANVQPHSGSNANFTAYLALCQPGDKILGMDLSQGGHLTHGSPVNFSGKLYQFFHYGLDPKTERIDFTQIESLLKEHRPKLVVAGASSYPRQIDFKAFGQLCEKYQALLLVDMAHIAGLVAAGLHPSPIPYAQVVTSTTHKTLRGPRGGIILGQAAWEKPINSCLFPGSQGGPLEHVIAAKAVAFHEAHQDSFRTYQQQVITNAQTLANYFVEQGIELVTGGTDNHLLLLKTPSLALTGKEASLLLDEVGITCNKNMIPGDKNSPFVTSGLRLGTAALTSRGMKAAEMKCIGKMIVERLRQPNSSAVKEQVTHEVKELCQQFPLYPQHHI